MQATRTTTPRIKRVTFRTPAPSPGDVREVGRMALSLSQLRRNSRGVVVAWPEQGDNRSDETMMSVEIKFLFYLAAVICFVLAALPAGRPGLSRVGLTPLGLALFVFPTLWDTGAAAF